MQQFPGKKSGQSRTDYDFLNGVFEWIFYNLPPRADNSFVRSMYTFYRERGGLGKKQLQALIKIINHIPQDPPFNVATLEAIMRKKMTRQKNPLPENKPLYSQDNELVAQLEFILSVFPGHKAAVVLLDKLRLHHPMVQADKDSIRRFYQLAQQKSKAAGENS